MFVRKEWKVFLRVRNLNKHNVREKKEEGAQTHELWNPAGRKKILESSRGIFSDVVLGRGDDGLGWCWETAGKGGGKWTEKFSGGRGARDLILIGKDRLKQPSGGGRKTKRTYPSPYSERRKKVHRRFKSL